MVQFGLHRPSMSTARRHGAQGGETSTAGIGAWKGAAPFNPDQSNGNRRVYSRINSR